MARTSYILMMSTLSTLDQQNTHGIRSTLFVSSFILHFVLNINISLFCINKNVDILIECLLLPIIHMVICSEITGIFGFHY